jgi:hypothetical protein
MSLAKLFGLALVAVLPALALATGDARAAGKSNTEIRLCKNAPYALCAASTCKETGKTIAVNTPEGGTRNFPEAECTCPVLPAGDTGAVANVTGGNMQGSCKPPKDGVWSLYSTVDTFPQKVYGWNYHAAVVNQACTTEVKKTDRFVNCWSFSCDNVRTVKSEDGTVVTLASCHCPISEDVFSTLPVKPGTTFVTKAGGDLPTEEEQQKFCSKLPVGGF